MKKLIVAIALFASSNLIYASDLQSVATQAQQLDEKAGAIALEMEQLKFQLENRENDISVIIDKINLLQSQIYALSGDLDQVRAMKDCSGKYTIGKVD